MAAVSHDLRTPLTRLALRVQSLSDPQEAGQDVRLRGSVEAPPLLAQACAWRRCVGNLVENAVRYGQRARITLTDHDNLLEITVHDDGLGMAEHELGNVLMPFYRLELSRNRNSGGVGLGLATAHDIALKHKGSLTLTNDPASGLVATLLLPRLKDGSQRLHI